MNRQAYRRHGLTGQRKIRVYESLLQKQQGKCSICDVSQEEIAPNIFQIDHSHTVGWVRGLLCQNCNSKLGMAEHYGVCRTDGFHYEQDNGWVWEPMFGWLERYKQRILSHLQSEVRP